MKELIILKIGGSICTEKEKEKFKVRTRTVRRVAREIKSALKKKKFKLIIVHGAGPFGHVLVNKWGINNGLKTKKHWRGFFETSNSMKGLRQKIVGELMREGVHVFPITPSSIIKQNNKKIKKFEYSILEKILRMKKDIIPLLSGDMVLDEKLGASVISGDAIASYLGKKLNAKEVVFGTNVEGVLDSNGKLIKEINEKNYSKVCRGLSGAKSTDVTGGMKGKIEKIRQMSKGIKVIVFNMNKGNRTFELLVGKKVIGTEINF